MTGPVTRHSVSTGGGGTPLTAFKGVGPFPRKLSSREDWETLSRGNTSCSPAQDKAAEYGRRMGRMVSGDEEALPWTAVCRDRTRGKMLGALERMQSLLFTVSPRLKSSSPRNHASCLDLKVCPLQNQNTAGRTPLGVWSPSKAASQPGVLQSGLRPMCPLPPTSLEQWDGLSPSPLPHVQSHPQSTASDYSPGWFGGGS